MRGASQGRAREGKDDPTLASAFTKRAFAWSTSTMQPAHPSPRPRRSGGEERAGRTYRAPSPACSPACSAAAPWRRLPQLYLRWNFSTRPVVSTYFILPVKNGWHAEQISTVMFFLVLRVVNRLPQPQVTVASSYLGWISAFMVSSGFCFFEFLL